MAVRTSSQIVFACHSASCRPPTSGGTGGSSSSGGKKPTTAGPDWGVRNSGSRVGWQRGRPGTSKERLEKDGYVHVVEPEGRSSWKRTTTKDGKKVKGSLHTTRESAQRSAEKYVEGGSSRYGGILVKGHKYT